MSTTTHRSSSANVRLLLAVLVGVIATLLPMNITAAHANAVTDQPITRHEIIARAQFWYQESLHYDQGATAPDPEGTTYRTDCSGFVSMAWHISPTGGSAPTTDQLPNESYTQILTKTPDSTTDLQPGDVLDDPGVHMALFAGWASADHTSFYVYEFGGGTDGTKPVEYDTWTFAGHSSYWALRYRNIMDDSYIYTTHSATTTGSCSSPASEPVPGQPGLSIMETTCTWVDNSGGQHALHVSISITWTGGGTTVLDNYEIHVQAQLTTGSLSRVTQAEDYCSGLQADINAASTGSDSCTFMMYEPAGSGSWTADGWLHAEAHAAVKGFRGAQYTPGGGTLAI